MALSSGFAAGGGLALARLWAPPGPWDQALATLHGQSQLFGWATLMVLGIGLHFLPRLRGAPLPAPSVAYGALTLLIAGLIGEALAAWALIAGQGELSRSVGVVASLARLAGGVLAVALLAALLRRGPPLHDREGLVTALPLFATTFISLVGALILETVARFEALSTGALAGTHSAAMTVSLHGYLVVISVAMGLRTFALFFRTPLAHLRILYAGLALAVAGLAMRLVADLAGRSMLAAGGRVGQAIGLVLFIVGLGVFARRRPLPRIVFRPWRDPTQWHLVSAFGWLALTAALLLVESLAFVQMGARVWPAALEQHLLGAGFVTLLILGMGTRMLPAFRRQPVLSEWLSWLNLALGNLAVGLRIVPLLVPLASPAGWVAAAGLSGWLAIAVFTINVFGGSLRRPSLVAELRLDT